MELDELRCCVRAYRPRVTWRPRTHLHAEMVKRRRDPVKSVKEQLEKALRALQAGDEEQVERLMRREEEQVVAIEWQERYCEQARAYWDQFYREKTVNFFKDRHYLREEFAELMPPEVLKDPKRWVEALPTDQQEVLELSKQQTVLLELGCAVGNGLMPLLRANDELFGVGVDLSAEAVRLLRSKEEYRCGRCLAFPCAARRRWILSPSICLYDHIVCRIMIVQCLYSRL